MSSIFYEYYYLRKENYGREVTRFIFDAVNLVKSGGRGSIARLSPFNCFDLMDAKFDHDFFPCRVVLCALNCTDTHTSICRCCSVRLKMMFGMQIDWRVGLDFLFSVRLICILNEACRGWAPDALRPWSKSLSTRLADVMTGRGQEPGLSRDPVTSPGGCLNSPPPRFNSSGVTVRFQCHRPSAHAVYHWRWHWNFSSVGFQTELMRSRRLETELLRSVRRIRGIEVVLICGWGSPARKLGSIIFFFYFSLFLSFYWSSTLWKRFEWTDTWWIFRLIASHWIEIVGGNGGRGRGNVRPGFRNPRRLSPVAEPPEIGARRRWMMDERPATWRR